MTANRFLATFARFDLRVRGLANFKHFSFATKGVLLWVALVKSFAGDYAVDF